MWLIFLNKTLIKRILEVFSWPFSLFKGSLELLLDEISSDLGRNFFFLRNNWYLYFWNWVRLPTHFVRNNNNRHCLGKKLPKQLCYDSWLVSNKIFTTKNMAWRTVVIGNKVLENLNYKKKKKETEKRTRVIYSSVKVNLTLCLVGWNLGGIENIGEKMWIFCCLGTEENEREWKTGRKLSLRAHKFLSPQFERISWERKVLSQHFYHISLPTYTYYIRTYPPDFHSQFCFHFLILYWLY